MTAESLRHEGARDFAGLVRQQLRLDAVNAGRLLQRFDHVGQQPLFDFAAVQAASAIVHKQVADHALALFVDKKGVTANTAALDGRVTGKDLGVHVTQNHLRRAGIIPGQFARPRGDFLLQERAKVGGGEVAEIEDFHKNRSSGLRSQVSGSQLTCVERGLREYKPPTDRYRDLMLFRRYPIQLKFLRRDAC